MKICSKIAILFALFLVVSCKKDKRDAVAPVIEFKEANLSADKTYSIVTFAFYDGDGDLGLVQNENTGNQEFNLFVDYYEMIDGVWTLKSPVIVWNTGTSSFDTTELHLRIPFIVNETKQALEGQIDVDLLYNFLADTIRYEIFIKDRALNESNKITTSEIIIN